MKIKTFKYLLICGLILGLGTNTDIFGQKIFRFSGKIAEFDENQISVTIYRNWVESPLEFQLKLDNKKRFVLETVLDDIAYFDINIGEYGFFQWKIEPNDNIIFEADYRDLYNTLKISGEGSAKFRYFLEQEKKFTREKDWDYELDNLKKISRKGYFDITNYVRNEQINLLNKYRNEISDNLYTLQRADIYGKYNNIELGFLLMHNIFTQEEFNNFNLKMFSGKVQDKSHEFGVFVESLIDNHNKTALKYSENKLVEYETIKDYFETNDWVERQMIERILASKIIQYIEKEGAVEENKLLVGSFKNFAKNQVYSNEVIRKIAKYQNFQSGKPAKGFILPDEKGNLVALKDFKGKNIILVNYASWCGPCLKDLEYLKIVINYFKSYNDLILVAVSHDTKEDFQSFVKLKTVPAIHLIASQSEEYMENYNTDFLPNYMLIDKSGTIVIDKIEEPSLDEGRSLIRQIEALIYKK